MAKRDQCESCKWEGNECPGMELGPEGCQYHYPAGPVCANCKHRRQYFDGWMICGLTRQLVSPQEPGCYFWEGESVQNESGAEAAERVR